MATVSMGALLTDLKLKIEGLYGSRPLVTRGEYQTSLLAIRRGGLAPMDGINSWKGQEGDLAL